MPALLISAACVLLSAYFFGRAPQPGWLRWVAWVATFTVVIACAVYYGVNDLTGEGINEATLFHVRYGLHGAGVTSFWRPITLGVTAILGTGFALWRWVYVRASRQGPLLARWKTLLPAGVLWTAAVAINPLVLDVWRVFDQTTAARSEKTNAAPTEDFDRFYRAPSAVLRTNEAAKNLVFLYAESLERTYLDQSVFPGLTPELAELEHLGTTFTNLRQLPGTGWTVAGILATQCALPLFAPSHGNSMSGMDQFMPAATCLGDLLAAQGYQVVFMGGADPAFAGKRKLLQSHGFHVVLGREELSPRLQDPQYLSPWGLFDDALFQFVFEDFLQLARLGKPFALFALTLDTHHPSGHPSRSVEHVKYRDGDNPMLNAVAGSSRLISELLRRILASEYAKSTVVALASDHLAMASAATPLLKSTERRNLLVLLGERLERGRRVDTLGSTLDVGPTLLSALGFSAELGLGRDLLAADRKLEEVATIHQHLSSWREDVWRFWDFPVVQAHLTVSAEQQELLIDERRFPLPVLVEFNEALETKLRFEFDSDASHQSLVDHLLQVPADAGFVFAYIDAQGALRVLAGRGGQGRNLTPEVITQNRVFSARDLRTFLAP